MQTFKTSKARENILAKIRKELNKDALPIPFPEIEKRQNESVYTPAGTSIEVQFAESFSALGGKFVFCADEHEFADNIISLYENRGWSHMLCAEDHFAKAINKHEAIARPAEDMPEKADACITTCELLIARTGSVIISSHQNLGRTSSVFYPVHIIVAYIDQVMPDIMDGINYMKKKYGTELPSMINLNTGPSRTADIEKTLVVGVHGPGEVFCFLLNR